MRHLYRSQYRKVIGGVCGGLGEYLNIDPVIIRIIWLIMFFVWGIGLIAYIIAWMIIPVEDSSTDSQNRYEEKPVQRTKSRDSAKALWGIFLIVLGFLFLAREFWYFNWAFHPFAGYLWKYFIPVLLIVVGIYIVIQGDKRSTDDKTGT